MGAAVADYVTLRQQAAQLSRLAQMPQTQVRLRGEDAEHDTQVMTAYRWLAKESSGQVLLGAWAIQLLQPCKTPEDEGVHRCIRAIFESIRTSYAAVKDEEEVTL